MKETTYLVRLAGGYYHKEKSRTVTLSIDGTNFTIATKQIIFWNPTADQKGTEFLIEISEDQLKILKSISKTDFDIRYRYGTGSLPPIIRRPPPGAQFLLWS